MSSSASLAPLPLRIRAELFTQLATLENAGLPAVKAFSMIELNGNAQARLDAARQRLAQRGDIALAGESSGLFTKLDARLLRAAITAGSPGRMYQRLAEVYTQRAAQAATVKSRLTLPAFILLLAVCISPLPSLVTGAIGVGGYVWKIARPLLLVAVVALLLRQFHGQLPIFKALNAKRNQRDFFESLALMLEAGISMLDALPAALDTIDDPALRRSYSRLAPQIAKGATFAQALATLPNIANTHLVSFVQTGESSGTLPEMLFRHVAIETASIDSAYEQLALWAPRIIYGLVALWIAYGLVSGPGVGAVMPAELR